MPCSVLSTQGRKYIDILEEVQQKITKTMRGLEHMTYKESLREILFLSPTTKWEGTMKARNRVLSEMCSD